MTGAGQNICLLDLGPSEALSNRWSLNLPLTSNITNKQHRPGVPSVRVKKKKKSNKKGKRK